MGEDKKKLGIHRLSIGDFLSFSKFSVELAPLNVLIGPNGSGKSNLIDMLAMMRATAGDLPAFVRRAGGIGELLRKEGNGVLGGIDVAFDSPNELTHELRFAGVGANYVIDAERIEDRLNGAGSVYYESFDGLYKIKQSQNAPSEITRNKPDAVRSILAQRRDPEFYSQLNSLAEFYEQIRIFRDWSFGRHSVFRDPQRADLRYDRLEEDFSNLGLFLSRIQRFPKAKNAILNHLRDLYDGLDDFVVVTEGNTVQIFMTEGEHTIPATRLSDGTLRYLCLLAILCDPEPAPVTCIEEPELGLHPDILPKLADLLIEASERTQLIVTTHSDFLVDAMTERPECVLVCDKVDGVTTMKRLSRDDLSEWLKEYRLGDLWLRGKLGGTRW